MRQKIAIVVAFSSLSCFAVECSNCGMSILQDHTVCSNCGRRIPAGYTDFYLSAGLFAPYVAIPVWHTVDRGTANRLKGLSLCFFSVFDDTDGVSLAFQGFSSRHLNGAQIGAINMVVGDVNGVQLGVISMAETVNGCQIGFANKAMRLYGVQLGIININAKGPIGFFPVVNIGW